MKRSIIILLFTFLVQFAPVIIAQASATLYFTSAFPMGEFKENVPNAGFGASTEFFFFSPSKTTPYGLGLDLSYVTYGINFLVDPNTDDFAMSLDRANNFASVHILFQIAPSYGSVRPYVETLFGGSYIFSSTKFSYDYYPPASLWVDDWAWSYGVGMGVKLITHGDPFFNSGSVYIDLKVRYLFGTNASYLDRNSVYFDGDLLNYSTYESKTDMLTASVGLYFFF